jgi:ATP-binding protein involved in chromosome partitioning
MLHYTPYNHRSKNVKIAIPLADGRLSMHFGHAGQFALVEADADTKQILKTHQLPAPPHEPGVLPRWLHEQGADMIIAAGMGHRAQQLFAQNGIKVVLGAPGHDPETVVSAFLNETLETGENPCDH